MTDYQKYQLQWMIDHGYSLQDLMRGLTEFQYDDPEDSDRISTPISELFNEWEFDRGFGSEIWACEGEWREVECPQRKAVNIQWDIDPEDDDGVELPNEITIPNDIENVSKLPGAGSQKAHTVRISGIGSRKPLVWPFMTLCIHDSRASQYIRNSAYRRCRVPL